MLNRIYTIGHSTRTLGELVDLLREHGVTRLADIRRFPGSRRYPHFSGESLAQSLPAEGIAYEHFEDLGGRRKPATDSPNGAWKNDQFRGYADYMSTPEFHAAVDHLLDGPSSAFGTFSPHAGRRASAMDLPSTAVMCAEAVPWRCHRNLLADELARRAIEVIHVLGPGASRPHQLSKMARIGDGRVTYPPEQSPLFVSP